MYGVNQKTFCAPSDTHFAPSIPPQKKNSGAATD